MIYRGYCEGCVCLVDVAIPIPSLFFGNRILSVPELVCFTRLFLVLIILSKLSKSVEDHEEIIVIIIIIIIIIVGSLQVYCLNVPKLCPLVLLVNV